VWRVYNVGTARCSVDLQRIRSRRRFGERDPAHDTDLLRRKFFEHIVYRYIVMLFSLVFRLVFILIVCNIVLGLCLLCYMYALYYVVHLVMTC